MRTLMKCLVAGAVAALCTTAQAQQKGDCKADVEKLCKDVKPGEGRTVECLKTHQAELSPKCSARMKQVKAEVKKVSDACEPDVEKYCFDAPIGKGGIASCLKKHAADLSPDCKSAVQAAKSKAK